MKKPKLNKRLKNYSLKSKLRTFKKKFFKNLNDLDFKNSLFYYNLIIKNLDIITNKNIFKKKNSSNFVKSISYNFKKKLFFEFINN